ncbi:hypothetical protein KCU92_g6987, partial [Aureobasidium melanogenum]
MLYTTASEALVQPKLTVVSSNIALQGLVKSIFANRAYMEQQCFTPVTISDDPNAEVTCVDIRYAYQGNLDLQNYLSQWESIFNNNESGFGLLDDPSPATLFNNNNTRVASSWIEVLNTTTVSGRVANNVTLAVPHIGVIAAARNPRNKIIQLQDLDGQANYSIRAQVHSPVVNVLCVNMNKDELAPIVYTEWSNNTLNATLWLTGSQLAWYQPGYEPDGTYLNATVVDDLFGWGENLAEALAVLASGMTLMATEDTQFTDAWNYSSTILDPGQYQSMNATLLAKEYTSGDGRLPATNAFYAVLAATFLLDLLCLGYFVLQNGLITDFTEPFGLFALAINSPPSAMMAGSSSTGPSKDQVREKWFIEAEGEDLILGSCQDLDNAGDVVESELGTLLYERTLLDDIRRSRWLRKAS